MNYPSRAGTLISTDSKQGELKPRSVLSEGLIAWLSEPDRPQEGERLLTDCPAPRLDEGNGNSFYRNTGNCPVWIRAVNRDASNERGGIWLPGLAPVPSRRIQWTTEVDSEPRTPAWETDAPPIHPALDQAFSPFPTVTDNGASFPLVIHQTLDGTKFIVHYAKRNPVLK